jgi:RNA polymerase sigma factor (sigma-70 family)
MTSGTIVSVVQDAFLREKMNKSQNEVIRAHLPLLRSILRRMVGTSHPSYDDMFQEGMIAIHRAHEKFDPKAGASFATYAHTWIRSRVARAIPQHSRTIQVPAYLEVILRRVSKGKGTEKDVARCFGVPGLHCKELDAEYGEGGTLHDVLPGREASPELGLLARESLSAAIQSEGASPARTEVINLTALGYTPTEIAELRGVSRQRINEMLRQVGVRQRPNRKPGKHSARPQCVSMRAKAVQAAKTALTGVDRLLASGIGGHARAVAETRAGLLRERAAGATYEDMAARRGISVQGVRSNVRRALRMGAAQ